MIFNLSLLQKEQNKVFEYFSSFLTAAILFLFTAKQAGQNNCVDYIKGSFYGDIICLSLRETETGANTVSLLLTENNRWFQSKNQNQLKTQNFMQHVHFTTQTDEPVQPHTNLFIEGISSWRQWRLMTCSTHQQQMSITDEWVKCVNKASRQTFPKSVCFYYLNKNNVLNKSGFNAFRKPDKAFELLEMNRTLQVYSFCYIKLLISSWFLSHVDFQTESCGWIMRNLAPGHRPVTVY